MVSSLCILDIPHRLYPLASPMYLLAGGGTGHLLFYSMPTPSDVYSCLMTANSEMTSHVIAYLRLLVCSTPSYGA